ncbi:UNVERIFIED_CONTAM: dockerin type I repeat protein [Acetivibrio alkalicellulosi]
MSKVKKIITMTFILTAIFAGLYGYSYASEKIGDLNSDGNVNSTDAVLMRRFILGVINDDDINTTNGDINGDGKIDSTDYVLLRRYVLEVINDLSKYHIKNKEVDLEVDYEIIRTMYNTLEEYPRMGKITANSELSKMLEREKEGDIKKIQSILNKYSNEYFEENSLIYLTIEENSGSIKHEIESIKIKGELFEVNLDRYIKQLLNADMAYWLILIKTPNEVAQNISEYMLNIETKEELVAKAEIIRTYTGGIDKYPDTRRIKSNAELADLLEGSGKEVEGVLEKYTDEYLENNGLIFVALEEGSGSIRHELKTVITNRNTCIVNIERQIPLEGTTDIAYWVILVSVPRNSLDRIEEFKLGITEKNASWQRSKLEVEYELFGLFGTGLEETMIEKVNSSSLLKEVISRNEMIYSRLESTGTFFNKYSDDFFENNDLMFVAFEELYANYVHSLLSVELLDEKCIININKFIPLVVQPSTRTHLLLISVPKNSLINISEIGLNFNVERDRTMGRQIFRVQNTLKEYPTAQIIQSNSELLELLEGNLTKEIQKSIEKYTDEYLQRNELIFVAIEENSGSIRHSIKSVLSKEGIATVNIERHIPDVGSDDMAYWVFLIETTMSRNVHVELNFINK